MQIVVQPVLYSHDPHQRLQLTISKLHVHDKLKQCKGVLVNAATYSGSTPGLHLEKMSRGGAILECFRLWGAPGDRCTRLKVLWQPKLPGGKILAGGGGAYAPTPPPKCNPVHVAEELLCNHAVLMDQSMNSSLKQPSYVYMYVGFKTVHLNVGSLPTLPTPFALTWMYTARLVPNVFSTLRGLGTSLAVYVLAGEGKGCWQSRLGANVQMYCFKPHVHVHVAGLF